MFPLNPMEDQDNRWKCNLVVQVSFFRTKPSHIIIGDLLYFIVQYIAVLSHIKSPHKMVRLTQPIALLLLSFSYLDQPLLYISINQLVGYVENE